MKQKALEDRKLTVILTRCSEMQFVVGYDGIDMISGDHLRKGTRQFKLSRDPPDAWLLKVDQNNEALLLDHSMGSGTAPICG
jgi:hypothetical protein